MASWLKSLLGLAPAFEVGDLVETCNLKNKAFNDVTGRVVGFRQDGRINVELISFKKGQVLGLKAEKLIKIGRESDNEEDSDTEDQAQAEAQAKAKAKQQEEAQKVAKKVKKSKKQLAKEKAQQAKIEKQRAAKAAKDKAARDKANAQAAAAQKAKEEEERAARAAQEKQEAARRKKEQKAEEARAAAAAKAAKAEAEAAAKKANKHKKAKAPKQASKPKSKPKKQEAKPAKAAPAPSKKTASKKNHKKSKKHAPAPAPTPAPVAAPRAADVAVAGEWDGDAMQRFFFVFVVPSVLSLILAFILFSAGDPEVNDAKIGYIKSRQLHFAFMGVLVFSLLKRFENTLPLITTGVSEGETLVQGLKNSAFTGDAVALNLLLASAVFPFPAFCAMVLVALGRVRRKVCGEHGQGSAEALAIGSMLLEGMIMVVIVRCLAGEKN